MTFFIKSVFLVKFLSYFILSHFLINYVDFGCRSSSPSRLSCLPPTVTILSMRESLTTGGTTKLKPSKRPKSGPNSMPTTEQTSDVVAFESSDKFQRLAVHSGQTHSNCKDSIDIWRTLIEQTEENHILIGNESAVQRGFEIKNLTCGRLVQSNPSINDYCVIGPKTMKQHFNLLL